MNVREIEALIQKHMNHNQAILLCVGMTTETALALEQQGDHKKVAELEKTVQEYLTMEQNVKNHISALGEIKNQLANGEFSEDEDLAKVLNARLKQMNSPVDFKRHPKYREFRLKIWRVHHPDEALPEEQTEELIVMESEGDAELRCPITRALFEHPYKNAACGHTYERDAILKILKGPPRGPKVCPIAGCTELVREGTLERDIEMEIKIKRRRKQLSRSGKERDEDVVNL
jgi:hypothetical protein